MLFAAGRSVTIEELAAASGEDIEAVGAALARLEGLFAERGVVLLRLAGGVRLASRPEHAEAVRTLLRPEPTKLTPARLETLAVIAYRQPLTRAEVEAVRGVDCHSTVRALLELDLIEPRGRRHDKPGKPVQFGTTDRFLDVFGLACLEDLPPLEVAES
ncbi:MAG: SMC-Scp complex subunit ScpB [Armatimonadetes bacterium]|nr:SMC-Scp complex subunit ScpB [Armatimonadota bacterium]